MTFRVDTSRLWIGSAIVLATFSLAHGQDETVRPVYGPPKKLGKLENPEIFESSGIASSNRHDDVFWTHNDSGDEARLFAFNRRGEQLGTSRIRQAVANDWEAMGSFVHKDIPYLFAADVGNNPGRPRTCVIYITVEPLAMNKDMDIASRIEFTYEDQKGHDCEAVAFDSRDKQFLLVEKHNPRKEPRVSSVVWRLAWEPSKTAQRQVARRVGTLKLPTATGLDISPDGSRGIAVTYFNVGVEFSRRPGESWATALKKPANFVSLPARKQGESVCFGSDGWTLFLTSEGIHSPLFAIPLDNSEAMRKQSNAANSIDR